jgi:NAD(P)-dependent dehydrogenase (short-subunit alcohol dehydrogenase family)
MTRTALVTGGTDGIGKEIARRHAAHGISVVIVGRNPVKGAAAECELRQATSNANVKFLPADLSLMSEVNRFADQFSTEVPKLNYLILNAGIVQGQHRLTAEGIESNFATNYLSRFVLTQRMLPLLRGAGAPGAAARIVSISGAAANGKINYTDINLNRNFGILAVVRQFCEANDRFVIEQARRLAEGAQPAITITALKVGVVRTNIRQTFPGWMKLLVPLIMDPFLGQTVQQIASSAMPLILDATFEGTTGALFTHIRRFKRTAPGGLTASPEEGRKLWEFSERLASGE